MVRNIVRLEVVSQIYYSHPDGTLRPYQVVDLILDSGELAEEFSRYLNEDGTKWVRHGVYQSFHKNKKVSSEGSFIHGKENGIWQDFYDNGQLAAEGKYFEGKEVGLWRYWNESGQEEESDHYEE